MTKKALLIVSTVFLAILAVPALAQEASIDINVPPEMTNRISVCSSTILNSSDIRVFITNLGSETKIYSIKANIPEPLSGFVTPFSDALAAGQRYRVEPIWITVPKTITPGTYNIDFTARYPASGAVKDEVTKTLEVNVLQCHSVDVVITEKAKETCAEELDSVAYSVKVTNNGRFTATFDLEATSGGRRVDYGAFSENSLTLTPGSSKTVTLTLTPTRGLSGTQRIDVAAKERGLLSQDNEAVELNIKNCYDFAANLQPSEAPTCLGRSAKFDLLLTNNGIRDDTYLISGPDFITLETERVTVNPGKQIKIVADAKPSRVGKLEFDITVKSTNDNELSRTVKGAVNADECRGVAVIGAPSQIKTCENETVSFTFSIKNIGANDDTFDLTSNLGTLEKTKVLLKPDQIEEVDLLINTRNLVGDKTVTVSAKNPGAADDASVSLLVESCYSAVLTLTPEATEVCVKEPAKFSINLRNAGKIRDTYELTFKDTRRTVELNAGQATDIEIPVTYDTDGVYELQARAVSSRTTATDKSNLVVKPVSDCFSVEVRDGGRAEIIVDKAITVPVYVKNTGKSEDTYTITVEGPPWIYLSPTSAKLASGKEATVFMYVSPMFGTDKGKYTAKVTARSAVVSGVFSMDIIVGETVSPPAVNVTPPAIVNVTPPVTPPVTPNVTTNATPNVTANVTPVIPPANATANVSANATPPVTPPAVQNVTPPANQTPNETQQPPTTEPNVSGEGISLNISFGQPEPGTPAAAAQAQDRPLWKTAVVAAITVIIIIILIIRFAFLVKK